MRSRYGGPVKTRDDVEERRPRIVSLVVGIVATVLFGLSELLGAILPVTAQRSPRELGLLLRFGPVVVTGIDVLIAGVAAVVTVQIQRGEPVVDDFYAAPDEVGGQPGVLLRVEPFERGIPAGAQAWRILLASALYTTTRVDGIDGIASGLVVAPAERGSEPVR